MATKQFHVDPPDPRVEHFINRPIIIDNNNQQCSQQISRTYGIKAKLAQCLATLAIFLINFSCTCLMNSYFHVTFPIDFVSLYNKQILMTLIGRIASGILVQFIGGRAIIILTAVVLIGCWLIFLWFYSATMLFWLICIVSFTSAMITAPSYVYLAEIAQPNMRSILMATMNIAPIIGMYFSSYLLNNVSMQAFLYINLVFPIVGFVMMIFLPESPHWLANKGRYQGVESSLAWFRGWSTSTNVKSESAEIINNAQNNPSIWTSIRQISLYISAFIIVFIFAIKALSGITYLIMQFTQNSYDNVIISTRYAQGLYHLSAFVLFAMVTIISQRILILISLFSGSFVLILALIFGYLNNNEILSADMYSQSLQICLLLAIFFLNAGIGQVPLLLNGEIFPSRLRYVGAGIGLSISYLMDINELNIYSSLTLNSGLLVLGCVNMFGFISLSFLFPKHQIKL